MPDIDILERLHAKRSGDGWIARCPAHDDRNASLSVGRGQGGRTLLHCHAGCLTDAVMAALGGTLADLMPEPAAALAPRSQRARQVATYDYTDPSGTLVYQVVRLEPKGFRQRRRDPLMNHWVNNLDDVKRLVYRADELAGHKAVFITEGEKDANALDEIGLAATCNSGGAGKWTDDHARQLKELGVERVAIFPDNDDAGRAHAEDVARTCHAQGIGVRIVTLPDLPAKGDVSDFLETHDKAALLALVKAAPVFTDITPTFCKFAEGSKSVSAELETGRRVVLTKASAIVMQPVRWLWAMSSGAELLGRIPCAAVTLIAGREGVGKSA